MSRREITFISKTNVRPTDLATLGCDQGEIVEIEDHWNMSHIMHSVGIFPSVGQARKNGWNKPIPDGFWMKEVGKLKHEVCIWNPTEP
jgi:hypothetical protein